MTEEIRAELAASVLSVLVTVGERVDPGAAVVLLDSMKMEIPVLCSIGGLVTDLGVAAGDSVQEGDLLVIVAS